MKTIVLLGANGQLGTDIREVFSEDRNLNIIPVTRHELDVEETEQISTRLKQFGDFDILLNCTSYHKTDECEDYPSKSFAVNAIAVSEMAKFCKERNAVMFHISTDYVFGGLKEEPYREEDLPHPVNVYGNSKLAGEHFLRMYHDQYFIFRVSSLFGKSGASGKGGNFVETMLRFAKENKPLRVVSDQIMSPTHTLDIAKAIRAFIHNEVTDYGVYHCSGEGQCSWYDFAKRIFDSVGIAADLTPILTPDFKTKARRPNYSVLDNSKLNSIYRMPYWQDALEEYLTMKGHK